MILVITIIMIATQNAPTTAPIIAPLLILLLPSQLSTEHIHTYMAMCGLVRILMCGILNKIGVGILLGKRIPMVA